MTRQLTTAIICALLMTAAAESAQTRFKGYNFRSHVITDNHGYFPEINKRGKSWLQVEEGQGYSIVIHNPLPVRVAAGVTIDGLNTIDGKRTTPKKARKWIIEPNSSITVRGWQTDNSSLRRFMFTDQNRSYAEWKGKRDRKKYTRNLGVIGVAYFWNKQQLKRALNPPKPFAEKSERLSRRGTKSKRAPSSAADSEMGAGQSAPKAGTGMGDRENHDVTEVAFNYNTGMYRTRDVLAIYYEFAPETPQPQPFIEEYSKREFTPEMP